MRALLKFLVVVCFAVTFILPIRTMVEGQQAPTVTEAPTGFDNVSNGMVTAVQFKKDKDTFEEREEIASGLGPTYNAQACAECHQNPVTGAISQVTELRAGHLDGSGMFVAARGGSLIHSRATDASIEEFVENAEDIRSFRTSLNTLGDGFVECIADDTLRGISGGQPAGMQGEVIPVPVLEAGGTPRVGRFGWKNQHASLVSFSSDAYLNEMGITNPFDANNVENFSLGNSVAAFDPLPDPEDSGDDVLAFARFMRATKAPPRGAGAENGPNPNQDVVAGSALFDSIGCKTCHVRDIVTLPPGTVVNGGAFTVPAALGNKRIHPFGDFLLHDVGTGDGIQQNGPATTRNKLRTAPLWGLRTRNRLMHDGESLTLRNAIRRHAGEAGGVTAAFDALTDAQERQLIAFLRTL
jgi:CxxC motif-containing protein (DUF1111 family)